MAGDCCFRQRHMESRRTLHLEGRQQCQSSISRFRQWQGAHPLSLSPTVLPTPQALSTSHPNATSSQDSAPWFLDFAATDHITHDLYQLNSYQPYTGNDRVTIGNGSSLPIRHTGKGSN